MTYTFSHGFRLVVPYLHTSTTRVKGAWVGRTVKEVVSGLLPYLSDDKVEAIFTQSRLMVDGSPTSPSHLLSQRETLSYISHWHEPAVLADPINIVHADRDLIVVDKPSSIPVHPVSRFRLNTVLKILKRENPELFEDGDTLSAAHRIDRLASGLLILVKSAKAISHVPLLFHQRQVKKEYIARVKGVFPSGQVKVTEPIAMVRDRPLVLYGVDPLGKPSCTIFERESVSPEGTESIVRCQPITGRSHQIRVHLQWLGYPIVGDYKYGGEIDTIRSRVSHLIPEPHSYTKVDWCSDCTRGSRNIAHMPWEDLHVNSMCLHSLRYTSTHPRDRLQWTFEVPRPSWADF